VLGRGEIVRRGGCWALLATLLTVAISWAGDPKGPRTGDPTGRIPAIRATVIGVRFFESPATPKQHHYDDLFFYNAARYVYYELNLAHPTPGRPTSFTVEELWHAPGGAIVHRGSRTFTIQADWTASAFYGGARLVGGKNVPIDNPLYYDCLEAERRSGAVGLSNCSPKMDSIIQLWARGPYQVDLLVDKEKVATGWFVVSDKDAIYGEVAERARDRSAPTGRIAEINASVQSVQFYEASANPFDRKDRRYATRFPQTARHVVWELDLQHAATGQWVPLPIEALLYLVEPTGARIVQRKVMHSAVPADWKNTYHSDSFGWDDDYYWDRTGTSQYSPRGWMAGSYRVDLYVANRKVASGSFEIQPTPGVRQPAPSNTPPPLKDTSATFSRIYRECMQGSRSARMVDECSRKASEGTEP
jgi:hypothetical protein